MKTNKTIQSTYDKIFRKPVKNKLLPIKKSSEKSPLNKKEINDNNNNNNNYNKYDNKYVKSKVVLDLNEKLNSKL